jgi:5-methylcytosine-specific restriction endonuclease McrA
LIFNEIAAGLKAVNDVSVETESRYIPDEVKREVFIRDGGQCLCCGIKSDLEYDHIFPYSKGGQNTADNLQLLCRRCNASKGTGKFCKLHDKDLSPKP